jgi:hypothetical protein
MVDLDDVGYLTPADVDQLIMSTTHPGGTTPVVLPEVPQVGVMGNVDFATVVRDHMHQIPNHGHPVPLRAVMNIKLLVFWLKHQYRISLVPDMTVITVPTLRALRNQITFEGGIQ